MLPLFFGFFTDKFFSSLITVRSKTDNRSVGRRPIISGFADLGYIFQNPGRQNKEPAIDIAGLCLPLKPQKEKVRIFFHFNVDSVVSFTVRDTRYRILRHYTSLPVRIIL